MSFFKRLEQFARNFIRKKSTLLRSLKKKKEFTSHMGEIYSWAQVTFLSLG